MKEEVRIEDFICRVSSNYDVDLKNVDFQNRIGTAYCILELQKGEISDGIKVGFDFDFKVFWDEAPDDNGKMHSYVDAIFVQKLYRRYNSNLHSISYGAERFNISRKEYGDIIEEAIFKLNDAFEFRIDLALEDVYEGLSI